MCESGDRCIYVSAYRKPGNCSSTYFCIPVRFLYDERNFLILFTDLHVNRSGIRTSDRSDRYHHLYHDQEHPDFCSDRSCVKSSIFQGGIQKVLNVFNLSGHYDNFTNGVFDVTGIVYFISVIAICLFLTMQSIQKRRWN